ncbi:MAG: pyrroline-5-carboxylate reductase [Aminobacterium sp.]|uniref:Pyrroline-5-carboxylate reductase n=1 Tax=bioreactor metagenome TaxID=1076179 RepID=A0A645F3N2_9ZZZZ|nr:MULTISPECIES: pyrroline-5-carboxylate reductase [unclassified Aminobacterium]MDD2207537.1 pyrroline-5-carboxylate reductase [Aminobacterium sp.]MDD3427305.1 pyrroline-5-carboxylate reductase [Aminobacterium sp.]MDD4229337.1 pyrroline-5-carboxylate reductase [Aminobacterium sp.]MDD4552382.1 pyrroline-5-carboxylate reductase [Aminobacterium sp.]MEA4878546.1 pyrroline-5-carboxylate reductase [Aminobacterium sp.]
MVNKNVESIAVIGAGMLGGSVAQGWAHKKCTVFAYDKDRQKVEALEKEGVHYIADSEEAINRADVVVFALKPHIQLPVIASLATNLSNKLCFSMAAGLRLEQLMEAAPAARWIRGMTNICASVNAAFTAYTSSLGATDEDRNVAKSLFDLLGESEETIEPNLDAITGISGSGPAYMFTVLEALTYGGLRVGIPKNLALKASAATMIGAAKLVLDTGRHPADLKDGVVTPGGTTIEGLYQLEEGAVRAAFIRAITEATRRGKELGEKKKNS